MTTMRETITHRVTKFEAAHQRLKTKRFGFLVRPSILVLGTVVTIVGLITIPLPGQGWLTTFLGVAILSLEARWARSLLMWGVGAYDSFFRWYRTQRRIVQWFLIVGTAMIILLTFALIGWGYLAVTDTALEDLIFW